MNDYKIPLRRKFLMYVEGGQPVPPPPPIVKWLDVTRTDGLAESDRAAIAVFKAAGLCENDDYMTTDEAAAITQLPIFKEVTALITWDWSALSGMDNQDLSSKFFRCSNLKFTTLPDNFANKATDMSSTFRSCTSLALTSLPSGFGSVATNMSQIFGGTYLDGVNYGCPNLALTSLPDGFGSVAINLERAFIGCSNLALTSLPNGFGSVATKMGWLFGYQGGYTQPLSKLALTSLPDGFGSVAINLERAFVGCSNLALTSLPSGFGSVATDMSSTFDNCTSLALTSLPSGFGSRMGINLLSCFYNCTSLALTSLPSGFGTNGFLQSTFHGCSRLALSTLPMSVGTATSYRETFRNCTSLATNLDLGNSNFGQNAAVFSRCFLGSSVRNFTGGYFDLSSVNRDTLGSTSSVALEQFVAVGTIHVMFVANTLKYSLVNSAANLTNIDTESLLSLAECLSSSASGKTWTVTNAQFDTLMSEMYSETLSYIMYVMTKGWNVEAA